VSIGGQSDSFSVRPDRTGTAYVRVSRLTAKLLRKRASVPVVVTVAGRRRRADEHHADAEAAHALARLRRH
jgi:hypothetical protein